MIRCKPSVLKAALLAASMLTAPVALLSPDPAAAQVTISVQLEPPELPVYDQPPIPEPGYIWTPGYWAYDDSVGYYWVPGTWIEPPEVGLLWTPPYWGWSDGAYVFHTGYWGQHVGFYGGIDYGFGYGGAGYEGGRWDGSEFHYNSTVNNFGSVHITNVYQNNVTVINNTHVSFNGGNGGVRVQPTQVELQAEHERHVQPTSVQVEHRSAAVKNPELAAKANNGHPAIAATAKPADFHGPGVVAAHGAPAAGSAPTPRPAEAPRPGEAHPEAPGAHPPEHPAPVTRPEERPAPPQRPEERPAPPRPEERPTARPEERPAPPHPEERPTAHPEERPAPPPHPDEPPRPAVQPPRPAEPPHPAAQPPHPAEPPHPAAQPPHPAEPPHPAQKPPPKEEEKKPPQL